jgi:hypothetical protein
MPKTAPVDPDAQAFITAAAITDPTQQSAINTLVVDLKGYSIWTKMKAVYPFVGGTATSHKFNLKNPLDTDAAYRLTFFGGVTHSSNGIIGNGTNGYADTFLANNVMAQSNAHISVYSRTDYQGTVSDIASYSNQFGSFMYIRSAGNNFEGQVNAGTRVNVSNTDSRGLFLTTRTTAISQTGQKNTTQYVTASVPTNHIASTFKLLRTGDASAEYSPRNLAFASIGDGLTDAEALNFYTAVQAFQTTLGRSIGTQTVSDADAQAFVTAADIQDQVEATAINNLVIGMKADGLWSKMKAVYPFVGGTASSHSYNLVNTAQYQISWSGGITHNSNGVTFGGVNGYGDTGLIMSTVFGSNYSSYGAYIRNTLIGSNINGCNNNTRTDWGYDTTVSTPFIANGTLGSNTGSDTDSKGMIITTRQSSTSVKFFRNNVAKINASNTFSANTTVRAYYIGARNSLTVEYFANNSQQALHYISDSLTDTEAANFYTRVQNFNTALARQV